MSLVSFSQKFPFTAQRECNPHARELSNTHRRARQPIIIEHASRAFESDSTFSSTLNLKLDASSRSILLAYLPFSLIIIIVNWNLLQN